MQYLYISLLIFTLFYPLFKSFETKIYYYSKWKYLFPGILASAVFFITWDIWFTHIGIWQFNTQYILGFYIINLPIEEWLFFIVVPFACVFIYEVINYFVKNKILAKQEKYITVLLAISLLLFAIVYRDRTYTFTTFILLSLFLFIHHYVLRSNYLGKFYLTWLVCLIPFGIVNGILTAMPVLIYNNSETSGLRIYTIPVEDIFYGMLNLLQVITVYEWLKQREIK